MKKHVQLLQSAKTLFKVSKTRKPKVSRNIIKHIVTSLLLVFLINTVQAGKIFTSVSNGSWGSSSTWDQSGVPDVDDWPNDKVIINHAVTGGNITMNGSTSRITINNGGSLTLSGTLNVRTSGQVIVQTGGALSGNIIKLNTSSNVGMNGTVTSIGNMEIDGHFTGSPTIVCGGALLFGAQGKNQLFSAVNIQVSGNMTVNNAKLTWTSGSVTVGGNFFLTGTGDVDVPTGGTLDVSGTLSVSDLNSIDGPTGSGSGGIVSWGVGNVILSGNNKGLNNCPLPYASPFDLSTCSQAAASDVTPPVITLVGNSTENVTLGTTYTDAGATATDDSDGSITGNIITSSDVDVNTLGIYTVTYNVSDAAGNTATEIVRTVNVVIPTRSSIASGTFNDPNIWDCNCVPSTGDDVVIAHDVTLTTVFTVNSNNNFTVNVGKTLTFSASLNVAGTFTNNGTLIGGDLVFNGTSAQTPTLGSSLANLEINNSYGVTLSSNLDITSGLLLTDGQLNTGGNQLTLKASSSSTAYLYEDCSDQGSISGEITAEQYVPELGDGHHYLSTPMSGLTLSEWSDDFNFKLGDSYFPHLYYYDEANTQWVTPDAVSDALVVGRGYTGYFSGEIVVDITGVPNTGDITIPLTNNGDGWNLIGNPFTSPIDWDGVEVPSGVSGAVYVWDHIPAIWGRYATYLDGIGTNGGSNVVPMMQGFFMSSAVNTNIVFYCEDRIATDNPGVFYRKAAATDPLIRIQAGGFGYTTDAVVRFKSNATEDYDETSDALLFPAGDPKGMDFGTISSDDRALVINTVPQQAMNKKIPLYLKIGTKGDYEIEMTDLKHFSNSANVLLHDDDLGIVHSLKSGPYVFNSELSSGKGRFFIEATDIVLGKKGSDPKEEFSWAVQNNQLIITFEKAFEQDHSLEIYNIVGQSVNIQMLQKGNNVFIVPIADLKKNKSYIVRVHDTSHTFKLARL